MSSTRLEPTPARDWSGRFGAEELAARIRDYWAAKGHVVDVWTEIVRGGREPLVVIKSRLRAGLPPGSPASIGSSDSTGE
jgi:hypothetical protein